MTLSKSDSVIPRFHSCLNSCIIYEDIRRAELCFCLRKHCLDVRSFGDVARREMHEQPVGTEAVYYFAAPLGVDVDKDYLAPSCAKCADMALPIPPAAPVTIATFTWSFMESTSYQNRELLLGLRISF